jgi:hypothetical protein
MFVSCIRLWWYFTLSVLSQSFWGDIVLWYPQPPFQNTLCCSRVCEMMLFSLIWIHKLVSFKMFKIWYFHRK